MNKANLRAVEPKEKAVKLIECIDELGVLKSKFSFLSHSVLELSGSPDNIKEDMAGLTYYLWELLDSLDWIEKTLNGHLKGET